ncbi:DUF6189 family protein [Stackebrandtia nassauensis]|uniref:Uncharacterized protein n=1 Tax=Stackebrandtia nassauensis (strain DSM 44728 / CIP 108903 / NRRL B-16338 / NBRC 102104 / LLR-40K-21) TaxID=446470 RepID=D3PXV8_STANL|nr:DUF6189 family protein [Stackebrandtia nassauensis]ADD45287.1 hypothetical protein Snas_5657 [Stackebrandtia nassauensis DSM 44728]
MDLTDFITTSESVIERLVDKLGDDALMRRYADSIRGNSGAGEWQIAMEDLVALLRQHKIPVTATDLRDLNAVFGYLSQSPSEEVSSRAQTSLDNDVSKLTVV